MKRLTYIIILVLFMGFNVSCNENEVLVDGNNGISSFYIQKFNTTVEEYNKFLNETGEKTNYNDDTWQYADKPLYEIITDENCAVANISFLETIKYANWLSKSRKLQEVYIITEDGKIEWNKAANGYRLPTCEEWEWAAKGGNLSKGYKYPGSDNLDEVSWYKKNSGDVIHAPGMKKPNELGIYDMFGNVGEWCWDEYLSIPDIIILEGENRTDPKDWISIASTFRADYKHKWNRISFDELKKFNIKLDINYIEKYKGRAKYYTTYWKDESLFTYIPYSSSEMNCSYMGIRLVRNVE